MTRIYIDVPDTLASELETTGVLKTDLPAEALKDALRRHAARRLAEIMSQPTDESPMSLDEVQEEIWAYRREKRERGEARP